MISKFSALVAAGSVSFLVACGESASNEAVGEQDLTVLSVEACGTIDTVAGHANREPAFGGDTDLAIKDEDDGKTSRLVLGSSFDAEAFQIRETRPVQGCVKGKLSQGFEGDVIEVTQLRHAVKTEICGTVDEKWALAGASGPYFGGDTDLAIKDRTADRRFVLTAAPDNANSLAIVEELRRARPSVGCVSFDGRVHPGFEGTVIEVLGFTPDP